MTMQQYGCQSMVGKLRRVIVRQPDKSFANADPAVWNYKERPDLQAAMSEHRTLVDILKKADVDVIFHEEELDGLADAIYTHDSALVTNHGSIILQMGKRLREGEEAPMARLLEQLGIPELGRLGDKARAEGGDLLWLDEETLAVGIGFRTNTEGADQLTHILRGINVSVHRYDLPYYDGEAACLHLMSLISLVDEDLAVAYRPLLPVRLHNELEERGVQIIDVPKDEFEGGQGTNVLAIAPRDVILIKGNKVTESRLREAGCRVSTYEGNEISLNAEGGATCLTRPVLRDSTNRTVDGAVADRIMTG